MAGSSAPPSSGRADRGIELVESEARRFALADKTYIVKFKPPTLGIQQVIASKAEIHDEHIVFCDSTGKLAALFLLNASRAERSFSQ